MYIATDEWVTKIQYTQATKTYSAIVDEIGSLENNKWE